jgi:hypothetical protein
MKRPAVFPSRRGGRLLARGHQPVDLGGDELVALQRPDRPVDVVERVVEPGCGSVLASPPKWRRMAMI